MFLLQCVRKTPGSWCWFVYISMRDVFRFEQKQKIKISNRATHCVVCHLHRQISYLMKSAWESVWIQSKSNDKEAKKLKTGAVSVCVEVWVFLSPLCIKRKSDHQWGERQRIGIATSPSFPPPFKIFYDFLSFSFWLHAPFDFNQAIMFHFFDEKNGFLQLNTCL